MYMSSCEKKLNGYVNLKRTVGYQSTIIGEFVCYILACLSSCLITEWLQLRHEATSSCHRVSVYCTLSCFSGSVFTSMVQGAPCPDHTPCTGTPPATGIWWPRPETCSNLFTWGPPLWCWHLIDGYQKHVQWMSGRHAFYWKEFLYCYYG